MKLVCDHVVWLLNMKLVAAPQLGVESNQKTLMMARLSHEEKNPAPVNIVETIYVMA